MENISTLLKVTLTSEGERVVSYKKWDEIPVEFTIKNISKFDISIPLEYIQKTGLMCTVIDRKIGRRRGTWPGLPFTEIMNPFSVLHPSDQVKIKSNISPSDVEGFNQKYVDLDLIVGSSFTMLINDQLIDIDLEDTIPVLDIEKSPEKNK